MRALVMFAIGAVAMACTMFEPPLAQGIARDDSAIRQCELIGMACKADGGTKDCCYGQYEACLYGAGLKP